MSNLPPPGSKVKICTPQHHPSLPARPPPPLQAAALPNFTGISAVAVSPQGSPGPSAFTTFKPRSVATTQPWASHSPAVLPSHQQSGAYLAAQSGYVDDRGCQQPVYQRLSSYYQQSGAEPSSDPTAPQIHNPFSVRGHSQAGGYGAGHSAYDPELEAQVVQWQSAYAGKEETATKVSKVRDIPTSANNTPLGERSGGAAMLSSQELQSAVSSDSGVAAVVSGPDGKQRTVVRQGGGQTWSDSTLLEWDPAHFRLFVGNLAGEVTDESLYKAFSRFPSLQKARVVRDKRTTKSKGYGFVSFSDGDEYFQAAKEMQGKYIGSHPVLVKRSTTEIKAVVPKDIKRGNKGGKNGGHGHSRQANTGSGVHKKQSKTKGGLRILG